MLRRSACLAVAGIALLAAPASGAELLSTSLSTPAAAEADLPRQALDRRGAGMSSAR